MRADQLTVEFFHDIDQLQGFHTDWNRLAAGIPFREWEWLITWWRHYRQSDWQLRVAVVRDETHKVVGIAPWYADWTLGQGQTLRFLGSGKVCTDYATILTSDADRKNVCGALWDSLAAGSNSSASSKCSPAWDLLELEGVVEDATVDEFTEQSQPICAQAKSRELESCWNIRVPSAWDDFVAMLDKRNRQKVRSLAKKSLDSGLAELHLATTSEERNETLLSLIEVHQRRRVSLGQAGCFASPQFEEFLRECLELFGSQDRLVLAKVKLRQQGAAVGVGFLGQDTLYLYQCGMEPEMSSDQPGWLLNLLMVRECQRRGIANYNLLRGDEPYKACLGAHPQRCDRLRFVPRRTIPQIRYHVWDAGAQLRDWAYATWTGGANGG